MHTTTLRGVFPEPKPAYRRNFIKENVKSIKQMQGFLQEAGIIQSRPGRDDKYRNVPALVRSRDSTPHRRQSSQDTKVKGNKNIKKLPFKSNMDRKKEKTEIIEQEQKFTHRSMQTERTEDMTKLYETGVIKYPSPAIGKSKITPKASPHKVKGYGDSMEEGIQNLEIEEKDYIRDNITNIKPKFVKQFTPKVSAQAPPNYQRGVVPKYLRDRKEEDLKEEEEPCPDGHVLLPEEERKETLRVLRQSYADRIQELNSMPVRSDTLRVKKRKMEIEEELKRIDGGIKVFQRPKVYVKINA